MSSWSAVKARRAEQSPRLEEYIRAEVGYSGGMPLSDPDPALYAAQAGLMQRLSWVYSAVTAVAENTASLAELEVYERTAETETAIVNHEFEQLLRRPNEYQFDSQFEFFEAAAGFLKLSGNCYFFLNALSENVPPAEIYLLRPDRVQVIPDKDKFVRGYLFTVEGQTLTFEPWEVVHIKKFHPLNDWYGLSAIEALAMASESDFKMAEWNRNFFGRDFAKPQGALAYADFIDDTQWDKMKREAKEEHGGTSRRLMMLRGAGKGGVEYMQVGLSQKDMEFISGRQFTKEEIWTTLAPGLLQIMDKNVTEANSTAGEKTLREYVIWPMLTRLAQKFTARVLPRYGDNLVARFKDIRFRDRVMELSERTAYERVHTVAEIRHKYDGDEPLNDERDDLFPAQVTAPSAQATAQNDLADGLNANGDLTRGMENPAGDAAKASEDGGRWVTINGSPVFIKEGQSVSDAMDARFGGGGETGNSRASLDTFLKNHAADRNHMIHSDIIKRKVANILYWHDQIASGKLDPRSKRRFSMLKSKSHKELQQLVKDHKDDGRDGGKDVLKLVEAKAKPDAHTGAMIAFAIPDQIGQALLDAVAGNMPEGAELTPLDELHVTLAYLGEIETNGISRDAVDTVLKVFSANHSQLRGKVNGVGRFNNTEGDGRTALYAIFDSSALPDFRRELVKLLEAAGIAVNAEHGFVPHITLAYVPNDAEIAIDMPAMPITFGDVALAWGEDWETYRLTDGLDDALKSDLGKWQAKAIKRLKEHNLAACDFTSEHIPPSLNSAIAGALEAAQDVSAVKAIFWEATEWAGYP